MVHAKPPGSIFLFRPVLSRGETIDSCCSEDLVTVLEMKVEKKPFKVTDRLRLYRKGIMAASLKELLEKGDQIVSDVTNSDGINFSKRKVWN